MAAAADTAAALTAERPLMAVSTFTWFDHRDEDVKRVREALASFDEQGMIDPLGFGTVRDAFSDMLFPGISTVQTRARYFLFVPWIYRSLDDDHITPSRGERRARQRELDLVESLLRGCPDPEGVIGRVSRQNLRQLPSMIYWGGLATFGIRRFAGTRSDYVARLGSRRVTRRSEESDEDDSGSAWHPALPPGPDGLYDSASLDLRAEEAGFLGDRIIVSVPDTYLALLVREGRTSDRSDLPWEHPVAYDTPGEIRDQLHHAHLFAMATWGAGILYNHLLDRLLDGDAAESHDVPLSDLDYEALLHAWREQIRDLDADLRAWDRTAFWSVVTRQNPSITNATKRFVDWWLDIVCTDASALLDSAGIHRRLVDREAQLKGARAKLANRRARERSPTPQGGDLMTFRWPQVCRIVRDIHEGMNAQPA